MALVRGCKDGLFLVLLGAQGCSLASEGGAPMTSGSTDGSSGGADGSSGAAPTTRDDGSGSGAGTSTGDGTSTGGMAEPGPWDEGFPLPIAEQAPGDPEEGYRALLEEGYVSCGIPWTLWSTAKSFLGDFANGEPLPGRSGKNADVPYNWTVYQKDNGTELVSLNCLECHAGRFDGELVIGLGKADPDYTELPGAALGGMTLPEFPIPGIEEMTRWINRSQVIGEYGTAPNIGVNPADVFAVVLAAHRDPDTLEWHDEALLEFPEYFLPSDTPPWWRVKKKGALFFNGMARGDHRGTMMFASSMCTDTVEEHDQILSYFNHIRAFIASVEAPAYPFEIDQELADEGRILYTRDCAGCHGTYAAADEDEWYPHLLIPVETIDTDPTMAVSAANLPDFETWFNSSPYGETTEIVTNDPFPGYVAPPLDGIWATAPFLHNASVPNLWLVLDSTKRPTYWQRVDYDSRNFDRQTLGWPYVELDYGHDAVPQEQAIHIYDTTRLGFDNGGHTFGDHLTDEQRRAVLEYLKTL